MILPHLLFFVISPWLLGPVVDLLMDGLKGLQVKMFVPVDVSMDSTNNMFTHYKLINLKIFGRALFDL